MKIEIGGGTRPREGFTNVDQIESADIRCDLNSFPWPIASGVVTELYSSHCLEHLRSPTKALPEIARICQVGATVTIRVPDAISEGAMIAGHESVLSEVYFRNLLEHFPDESWSILGKILSIEEIRSLPDYTWFPRARECPLFAAWTDDQIMHWIPRTCHEREFVFQITRTDLI